MNHIAKLYRNKFLVLQEKYFILQEQYNILVEDEIQDEWIQVPFKDAEGNDNSALYNPKTGQYKFGDIKPLTLHSETLQGKTEQIPVAGPILSAAMKLAAERPVLTGTVALGSGVAATILANNRLQKLEKQRQEAIKVGKEIASEKLRDVPGISDPVRSEFKTVQGEKPISTARSGFGIAPGKDTRPSSRVYREFNPTLSPTVISTPGIMRGPTQTVIPNYSSPDLPGETFKLDKRTGEMVPNKKWTSAAENAPRTRALETLGKVAGAPTLGFGLYGAAEDIAAGKVPSMGHVGEIVAGTSMVAPKATGKAVTAALTKIAPKFAASFAGKKIPIVGALIGLGLAASRASAGDWVGAAGEAASGIAGSVPGIGTAVSAGIDAALLAKDLQAENEENIDTSEDEEKKRQEMIELQMGNAIKPSEVRVVGPKM